jgi:hypothetical protein
VEYDQSHDRRPLHHVLAILTLGAFVWVSIHVLHERDNRTAPLHRTAAHQPSLSVVLRSPRWSSSSSELRFPPLRFALRDASSYRTGMLNCPGHRSHWRVRAANRVEPRRRILPGVRDGVFAGRGTYGKEARTDSICIFID